MPNFIGRDIPNTTQIQNNAAPGPGGELVRITYAQAMLLPVIAVYKSLDTTDKGGPHAHAKRWYRWFARRDVILGCRRSTTSMLRRAVQCTYTPGCDCGAMGHPCKRTVAPAPTIRCSARCLRTDACSCGAPGCASDHARLAA